MSDNTSGKEKIIASILEGAEAEAEALKKEADKKIDEIRAADAAFFAECDDGKNKEIAANELSILSGSRLKAELDVRKAVLAKKQEKLSEAFKRAEEKILSDDEAYLSFISGALKQYAENEDTVVVAKSDEKRISREFIKSFAKENGLSLSYRADGKFSGGVILEGENCDKNLTIETILSEYKRNNENRIADILFGD